MYIDKQMKYICIFIYALFIIFNISILYSLPLSLISLLQTAVGRGALPAGAAGAGQVLPPHGQQARRPPDRLSDEGRAHRDGI